MAPFTFDGKEVPIHPGDTYGAALHRAGVRVLSRSMKYHRPRGLYCVQGSCGSCFVNADGTPNVPACTALAKDGCRLTSQNTVGTAQHDLLGIVDKVYWNGFDPHNAFTRMRLLNEVFLRGVRFMSGVGKPPAPGLAAAPDGPRRHTLQVDELVVGAGRSGLQRAHEAGKAGARVLLVDELPHLGGTAAWDPFEMETRRLRDRVAALPNVQAWTQALCFGIYGAQEHGKPLVAALRRTQDGREDLVEVTASRITLGAGSHDAWPLFTNNDLPGVLSLRGALRLLGEHKVAPGRRAVVHGDPLPKHIVAFLQNAGTDVVAGGSVLAARGISHVEAAQVAGDWVACDTILCNLPGTPRIELFQQAGCALDWSSGVLAAKSAGPDGATTRPGVHKAVRA
ncbi:MAG TPA: 2Fe-2S iron-sulfur cluster-binding protein [Candidatus Thermoplasmatota archaeon]|nr:2Fe-2S iron-sulfur cluster-binding protein [Candidatus Thermoplasmatota archaeon]